MVRKVLTSRGLDARERRFRPPIGMRMGGGHALLGLAGDRRRSRGRCSTRRSTGGSPSAGGKWLRQQGSNLRPATWGSVRRSPPSDDGAASSFMIPSANHLRVPSCSILPVQEQEAEASGQRHHKQHRASQATPAKSGAEKTEGDSPSSQIALHRSAEELSRAPCSCGEEEARC
jgi:hypothetical protein